MIGKLIKWVVIIGGLLFAASWLISMFLGPDDLASCGDKPSTKTGCQAAQAIVAVSGGDTSARAAEAIRLYKAGWAPKLIFSGAALDKSGPSNAKVMAEQALAAGVAEADIITEETSSTTKQNAENTENIFVRQKITNIILVTSAYHQRRAAIEFGRQPSVLVIRNHPVKNDNQWSSSWWMTPYGWILAFTELAKTLLAAVGVSS
jgi:uncharacterized SAM-binding protein YcdF (DUF218 family)